MARRHSSRATHWDYVITTPAHPLGPRRLHRGVIDDRSYSAPGAAAYDHCPYRFVDHDTSLQSAEQTARHLSDHGRNRIPSARATPISHRRAWLVVHSRHSFVLRHRRHKDHRSRAEEGVHEAPSRILAHRFGESRPRHWRHSAAILRLPRAICIYTAGDGPGGERSEIRRALSRQRRRGIRKHGRITAILLRKALSRRAGIRAGIVVLTLHCRLSSRGNRRPCTDSGEGHAPSPVLHWIRITHHPLRRKRNRA